MTTLDKVALILSKHGYSLTEGMNYTLYNVDDNTTVNVEVSRS